MRPALLGALLVVATLGCAPPALGDAVAARDATGVVVRLAAPARRVIALAPHLTEVVFALGAGARLVAVSDHSDYPAQARGILRLGDAFDLPVEGVLAQRPDLLLVWGASGRPIDRGRFARHGVAVYVSRPVTLDDVPQELRAVGALLGAGTAAARLARTYERRLAAVPRATGAPRVFLQIGAPHLFTTGDHHYLGEALRRCGAVNVFGALTGAAPQVGTEAVLAARPRTIVALDSLPSDVEARWRGLGITDVRRVAADPLSRPGPRLAEGVTGLCRVIASTVDIAPRRG